MKKLLILIAFVSGSVQLFSQTDTLSANAYENLSLKDLLNVKIVSVSKSSESLFDAPASASVITKEEIQRAGCASIMEALRLVPGMIVREQSNGNYDIQLRGVYAAPNSTFDGNSATTLVMIDNRPIFNYLKGGTFWESLPVALNDVEKIEVVRGPAGALYGPNAVNGVINIITRQPGKEGLYLAANSRQGSYRTSINNASIGYKAGKWSMITSGNYERRERTQAPYFELFRNKYLNNPAYLINILGDTVPTSNLYPNPDLAMEKYAGNVFVNYDLSKKIKFNLSSGLQHSQVQKVSAENGTTPLTTVNSDSRYADLRATVKGLAAQLSYIEGTQLADHQPGNKYDFNTLDATVEYNYTKGNLSLKPGLSYRSAIYDDTHYADTITKASMFNARGQLTTKSASMRGDYKLLHNKLRLVAALATNTFNYPDTTYLSYEFAATYKLNKKHLFRAVYSRSPRSAAVYDTYIDQFAEQLPLGYQKSLMVILAGNKNLKLLTSTMSEIGYRGQITDGLSIDVEVFNIHAKNFTNSIITAPYIKMNGADTIIVSPVGPTNIPLEFMQNGITVSLSWSTKAFQVKPYITVQQSITKNYSKYASTPDALPMLLTYDPTKNNIYSGMGTKAIFKAAPAVFGGLSANYRVTSQLNANLTAYYYTGQTITHVSNTTFADGLHGIDNVPGKVIVNATVSYEAVKGLHFFCTGKNLLNDKSREYFKTDQIPFMCQGGINFEL